MSARSPVSSLDSTQTALELFHQRWFGPAAVPPLNPERIYALAAVFLHGRCSSFDTHMARARELHIEPEFQWTEALERASRRSMRSVSMGVTFEAVGSIGGSGSSSVLR